MRNFSCAVVKSTCFPDVGAARSCSRGAYKLSCCWGPWRRETLSTTIAGGCVVSLLACGLKHTALHLPGRRRPREIRSLLPLCCFPTCLPWGVCEVLARRPCTLVARRALRSASGLRRSVCPCLSTCCFALRIDCEFPVEAVRRKPTVTRSVHTTCNGAALLSVVGAAVQHTRWCGAAVVVRGLSLAFVA